MRWIKKTISFLIIVNFLISPSLAMKRGLPLDQELPRKTAYILTVAGGGVRGVIPARVLSLLEERVIAKVNRTQPPGARKHVNFAELFDVVSGTSTGGIIVAGLNSRIHINSGKPKTPKDILQFYKNHAHIIFPPQNMFQKLGGLFSSKYSQEPLANLLKDTVGEETWISDTFTEMLIPTYDMRQGVSYLFKSSAAREHDSENFRTYEALLATAAAPTYFNAVPITSKDGHSRLFSDGGIAMNNPMLEAMTAASKKFPHHNLFFIALGTGRVPLGSYASLREAGLLKYASKLPALLMKNNERRARIAFEHIKGMIEREGRTATCYFIDPFLPLELAAMDSAYC